MSWNLLDELRTAPTSETEATADANPEPLFTLSVEEPLRLIGCAQYLG